MFYQVAKFICYLFLKFICRWEVKGREKFPLKGPVIVVANHVSYLDPVVVGVACPRRVHFMAKEELFHVPFLGWIIKKLHAFPVRREKSDRLALKTALEILRRGEVLGIFPEGTRSKTGELGPLQPGAASLALKIGATILPVAVKNTNRWLKGRIEVIFGDPLQVGPANPVTPQQVEDLTRLIHNCLKNLLNL
ncbi:MAG TPA: 1-acyl-sn-glycerol-3-phosphate acyltransferase [Moorella mulderi]|nr:1-acyl-sn-glycerol-3-phosphate acyltransferase [Moorella mulderi]